MASITIQADAVRSAVTSVQTCTPATSATLKELLREKEPERVESRTATKSRVTKPTQPSKGRANAASNRANQAAAQGEKDGGLGAKEKAVLATQVINATLKALGDAAKNPPDSAASRLPAQGHVTKPTSRTALRRSNSMPMTPLNPRSLNRVATSPATAVVKTNAASASSGCLATVECARVAFATLRSLSNASKITLPELQLESGMSSFINKLIALNLYEHAVKELRLLKRRLESMACSSTKKPRAAGSESNPASKTLAELFEYSTINASGPLLGLIITAQLQALRILYGLKKSAYLDAALPFLRTANQSSPLGLLLLSLKDEKPDKLKCARQLESLAQNLLSLTPSISTKDDGVAVEPRLSPSPETALEIQSLALTTRLHSWGLSGHKGDFDKEMVLPLSRCLGAFTRRSSLDAVVKFDAVTAAFTQVWKEIEALGLKPSESSKSSLAAIYQVLGTVSRDAGSVKEAKGWIGKLKAITNAKEDSAARCCAVAAQLLAISLKSSPQVDEALIVEVVDGLQGSLSGNTTELDDLLVSVCLARKAAMSILLGSERCGEQPNPIRNQLESLVLQLPRFALRWLGKPPAAGSSAKDLLRFEQRRQLLSRYIHHILDSALMLTKVLLEGEKLAWDLMDSMLQDNLAVLENMGDFALMNSKSNPAASYHVKISHFYYQQHLLLRKNSSGSKDTLHLRALRRSVEAVKLRSEAEQAKAQLLMKQERLAELCRASGRRDDAADALRSIRDMLVREDTVTDITAALSKHPLPKAWRLNDKCETLSRTVSNLTKLECNPCDWTWLLIGVDKATALEHDLYFVYSADAKYRTLLKPDQPVVENLLAAYAPESYPIRRLRTLLQLLTVNMESRDQAASWMEEAGNLSENIDQSKLGEDSGLARYIPHLKALTACVSGLFDSVLDSVDIKQALSTWKTAIADCKSADDLYKHVDNPPQLLMNLQSLAGFARMKGLETMLGCILEVSATISQLTVDSNPDVLVTQTTALCLQHLTIGHSSKAEKILEASQGYILQEGLSNEAVVGYHLCSAEYHMAVGDFSRAERHLADAQVSAAAQMSEKASGSSRLARKMTMSYASFLHSMLALERGHSHFALHHAKNAVRILFHDWTKLESLRAATNEAGDEPSQADISTSEGDSSLSSSQSSQLDITRARTGPEFWSMVYPLFRFVLRLSSVYAHVGMFQETMYYAEQALKIAKSTESATYILQAQGWLAWVSHTAGKTEKALELAAEVKRSLSALEPTCATINMACQLSRIFRDNGDHETESELMGIADSMLQVLNGGVTKATEPDEADLETRMQKLTIKEEVKPKTGTRQTKGRATKATGRTAPKKAAATRAKPPVEVKPPVLPLPVVDVQLSFLRASILQHQSASLLDKKDWTAAMTALRTAYELSKLSTDISQERLFMAVAFIGQSLEQMGRDSVFSVIQDSTLSFPAVAASLKDKTGSDRATLAKASPPRKARAAPPQDVPGFLEHLRQAQDCLLEAHAIASLNGDGKLVQRIAALLQSAFTLLSTTCPSRTLAIGHPAHATCSVELARNLTWRRERKTLRVDVAKTEKAEWPIPLQSPDSRRSSLGFSIDMNRFQKDYVDIIPKSWNVVSLSLSDNKHDLCITKLQAGHSPFAIRLPLERASSRDADNEVFDFEQGRSELLDIIQLANRTCHDARDMSLKGAKSAWWAEREALDARMKELVDNIERTWLGGFRGIFAQHHRRSDLLARFQKSFQNILDKHLPSRRQVRGKRAKTAPATKVTLDPRILDLFIGLGDATAPACDLDEPLTDLLYFVVDILQFHGERNAYDEIDFDSMVVETFDALHVYHAAANSNKDTEGGVHTILVLDKSLHIFPWESLPCMQELAISRIPSLACLRRSILEQNSPDNIGDEASEKESRTVREGHHVSIKSGTYILNPSTDLTSTQATFGKPLAGLPPSWTSIEGRAPSESEFEAALSGSDLLLYFGHGSGAQYIRGRAVRKLDKCRAVALLMGCSSVSLAAPGDFECHGPVWNYMLAGSPAVVGTLWDVTDRDIDRYAGRVFEEWGLLPRSTFAEAEVTAAKGKGKGKARGGSRRKVVVSDDEDGVDEDEGKKNSLVEAIARARVACRFRYLTAAAVVVYGIPVYIAR